MVHLHIHSWCSFLTGACSPATLAQTAAALGQAALARPNTHTLAGMVQFARACRSVGIKPIFGATVLAYYKRNTTAEAGLKLYSL